ncbi:hypothetical protein M5J09_06255, partial [Corynebacterium sp. BF-R-2]|nr:hypothetical protein [Corynebacterium sp. BF-R-2]
SAVAFERLTSVEVNADGDETPGVSSDKPNDIAQHENPKDEAQTVTSKETPESGEPTPTTKTPESGESTTTTKTPESGESTTTTKTPES